MRVGEDKIEKVSSSTKIALALTRSKSGLSVLYDDSTNMISFNKDFLPPVSWFLTNSEGELVQCGRIIERQYKLDLSQNTKGLFYLRIAGEVHVIPRN